jgi:hypothetical protein
MIISVNICLVKLAALRENEAKGGRKINPKDRPGTLTP